MNSATVKVQFSSPLSDAKSRIDHIHSLIERSPYVKPMIVGSGVRRALFVDSLENTERIHQRLRETILRKNNQSNELPVLPVTNPVICNNGECREEAWSVPKGEARLAVASREAADLRIEKRKNFHRNCVPSPPEKCRVKPPTPNRPVHSENRMIRRPTFPDISKDPPDSKLVAEYVVREREAQTEVRKLDREKGDAVVISRPNDIKELEQLILDTHEFLEQEGFKASESPKATMTDDLVAELEREIDQLTKSIDLRQKNERLAATSRAKQLEEELEKLINEEF